jgi:hypothetical protein
MNMSWTCFIFLLLHRQFQSMRPAPGSLSPEGRQLRWRPAFARLEAHDSWLKVVTSMTFPTEKPAGLRRRVSLRITLAGGRGYETSPIRPANRSVYRF